MTCGLGSRVRSSFLLLLLQALHRKVEKYHWPPLKQPLRCIALLSRWANGVGWRQDRQLNRHPLQLLSEVRASRRTHTHTCGQLTRLTCSLRPSGAKYLAEDLDALQQLAGPMPFVAVPFSALGEPSLLPEAVDSSLKTQRLLLLMAPGFRDRPLPLEAIRLGGETESLQGRPLQVGFTPQLVNLFDTLRRRSLAMSDMCGTYVTWTKRRESIEVCRHHLCKMSRVRKNRKALSSGRHLI